MLLTMVALLAAQSGSEKVFGDWAVTCDNGRRCEAVALLPEDADYPDEGPTQMRVRRDAGPNGGWSVRITPGGDMTGDVDVRIDGTLVAGGTITADGLNVGGVMNGSIVARMVNGRKLTVEQGGKAIGTVSLNGSSAMLRYIDAQQGRVGTESAVVAVGSKRRSTVPAAPALPRVTLLRPAAGAPETLGKAQAAALSKRSKCDEMGGTDGWREIEYGRLDARTTLVLLPCGAGAYNLSSAAWVLRDGKAQPARFDRGVAFDEGPAPVLVNTSWDAKTGELSAYYKGRGIGDCGGADRWGWDGQRFRLLEETRLEECRAAIEWPTVYRATPVY